VVIARNGRTSFVLSLLSLLFLVVALALLLVASHPAMIARLVLLGAAVLAQIGALLTRKDLQHPRS
jgi:hypothetical protein